MLAIPLQPPTPNIGSGHASALEEALKTERRLLQDLQGVLERQRTGVAGDDIAVVDDATFAAQRVLRTLAEARRRRRALLEILVGEPDIPLGELDRAMASGMTLGLRTARDELQEAARRVAEELDRNRRIIQGAITAGDKVIRALTGGPEAPLVYAAPGGQADARGSLLVNRQV